MSCPRLAAHLGFPSPEHPLFAKAAGKAAPLEQIAFAADQGFAGVLDPFTAMRSAEVQARIGDAAAARALEMGGFLYVPFSKIGRARWGCADVEVRKALVEDVAEAVKIARRLGSRHIAILSLAEPEVAFVDQARAMADNLRIVGDLAGAAGMQLCVEGVNRERLPQMLLHGKLPARDVVKAASHPAVRLLFDTGHVAASGEDVAGAVRACGEWIGAVQIADHPARVEMGAGTVDFPEVFTALRDVGYQGLCELEHGWSSSGAEAQRDYLAWLHKRGWLTAR